MQFIATDVLIDCLCMLCFTMPQSVDVYLALLSSTAEICSTVAETVQNKSSDEEQLTHSWDSEVMLLFQIVVKMTGAISTCWLHLSPTTVFSIMVSALSFLCNSNSKSSTTLNSSSKPTANVHKLSKHSVNHWPPSPQYFQHVEAAICPPEIVSIAAVYWVRRLKCH